MPRYATPNTVNRYPIKKLNIKYTFFSRERIAPAKKRAKLQKKMDIRKKNREKFNFSCVVVEFQ